MEEKYIDRDLYLIPKEHKTTMIFMHGLGDSPEGWKDVFTSKTYLFLETMKIILLCAPRIKSTFCGQYQNSWFDILDFNKLTEGSINFDDITKNSERIYKIIDEEAKLLNNDYSKIYIGGFSQGASMSLNIGLNCNHILGGVLSLSGILFPKSFNDKNLNKGLKIFCGHGESDNVIPFDNAKESYKKLNGENVGIFSFNGMAHNINQKEMELIKKYFNELY